MDSATKAISEVAKGDPVYVLSFALMSLIVLAGFAVRSIMNALFREPKSATDKGGLVLQVKDALVDFVSDVKEKNAATHDAIARQQEHLQEMKIDVQHIKEGMPVVCRATVSTIRTLGG